MTTTPRSTSLRSRESISIPPQYPQREIGEVVTDDIEGVELDLIKYLDKKNVFIGDIVVEGENLPKKFGKYILKQQKFNDMYYYAENYY